jgi:hypothetical protein
MRPAAERRAPSLPRGPWVMRMAPEGDGFRYVSHRTDPRGAPAELRARYRPSGPRFRPEPGEPRALPRRALLPVRDCTRRAALPGRHPPRAVAAAACDGRVRGEHDGGGRRPPPAPDRPCAPLRAAARRGCGTASARGDLARRVPGQRSSQPAPAPPAARRSALPRLADGDPPHGLPVLPRGGLAIELRHDLRVLALRALHFALLQFGETAPPTYPVTPDSGRLGSTPSCRSR